MFDKTPTLYVFMRTDLPDHTPGKALAQCNHAGTEFVVRAGEIMGRESEDSDLRAAFKEWCDETGTFGTCIVLGISHSELLALEAAFRDYALLSGLVVDPTYPIRNGHETITVPLTTCGWAFARRRNAFWTHLPLY